MYIIFDTETTGLPKNWNAPISDLDNWPRAIQIAWQVHDDMGRMVEHKDFIIKPDGFDIPYDAERIHGISTALAENEGVPLSDVLVEFEAALEKAKFVVGQNLQFDLNIMGAEHLRAGVESRMLKMPVLDTCTESTAEMCQIPGGRGGKWKLPTLTELHKHLFDVPFQEAHNATADVEATTRCFFELIRREAFTKEELEVEENYFTNFKEVHQDLIQSVGLQHVNLKEASEKYVEKKTDAGLSNEERERNIALLKDAQFVHLHNHSQFSILQATSDIKGLVKKTAELKMPAVALTDVGNVMAAFHFEKAIGGHNAGVKARRSAAEEAGEAFDEQEITPIIGCEFYVCKNHEDKSVKDNGYNVVLLAKNKKGYQNLIKLASYAFTQGMYYVPRIDKALIEQHHEELICLTGNLNGEVPNKVLNVGEKQAEEALVWWKELFKDDLYVEIMRHGQEDEERVNEVLIRLAKKHEVKLVATNNTYYLDQKDAESHDILLCLRDNELVSTPIGRGRGFRYGLTNEEYYFKTQEEMKELFIDLPEAILSIQEIMNKVEHYPLQRDVLLPAFDIPEEFQDPQDEVDGGKRGENNYLRHLTYEGAKKRYPEITDDIRERLDFELKTIENTGYPGYFLIVQDFCHAARAMGVSVGPGRGSAAGSAVAYCNGITNIDPIAYDLLFERFLNPERISMPDIDIDFDDEGRGDVMKYVIDKYGANQVAQIITYGTMAAKSSLRDTARVLDLPLSEASSLAGYVVGNESLNNLVKADEEKLMSKLRSKEDFDKAKELRQIAQDDGLRGRVVNRAMDVEGSVRNTGIHACGVIITPGDITNYVPVALAKDSDMYCTQYDNSVAEEAGLLKMDFLGLSTLTLIKHAVRNVKEIHGIEIDIENIPLDDVKTYELFQRGETVGIFQYESPGMQKYMKELKPTVFADLIAMNALYRPGPMEYIPSFIKRKHGEEEITYDLADCEEYLKETYGITVYQEQVMLLSQKLAGFTKGEADTLRKAMGKKKIDVLNKMKPQFIQQGGERGHKAETLEKIWKDWEAFASYAFNKSHSTCYAWIAYQTAYLKANYPAEFMASVLSNNMNDIKKVSFFMEECRNMGIPVLGPDVNESNFSFTINKEGAVRFGLGAVKGVGSGPVENIVETRQEGPFTSIFDFTKRVNLRQVNKKAMESLVYAGGFDGFKNIHRAQYLYEDGSGRTFLENAIKFGANHQENENSSQASLFGEATGTTMPEPEVPKAEEWSSTYKLNREKEVVGIYISGHPLDDFKTEIKSFCKGNIAMLKNMEEHRNKEFTFAAVISMAEHRFTRKGDPFGKVVVEDYDDSQEIFFWREKYLKFKHFLQENVFVAISGRIEVPPRRKDLEFTVHSIELLHEVMEKKAKELKLKINVRDLDQIMINDLMRTCMENVGNCQLKFTLIDELSKAEIDMSSRKIAVEPNKNLFKAIDQFNIEYELN